MQKAGTVTPGAEQQLCPAVVSPGVPGQGNCCDPQPMHASSWQLGAELVAVIVYVLLTPVGNENGVPPTASQGVWRQAPAVPPHWASELQEPNRFAAALVVQRKGPALLQGLVLVPHRDRMIRHDVRA